VSFEAFITGFGTSNRRREEHAGRQQLPNDLTDKVIVKKCKCDFRGRSLDFNEKPEDLPAFLSVQ